MRSHIDFDLAFTPGARFTDPSEHWDFEIVVGDLGSLGVPSGRLGLVDPGNFGSEADVVIVDIPAGTWPTAVSVGWHGQGRLPAAIRLRFDDARSASWTHLGDVEVDYDSLALFDADQVTAESAAFHASVPPWGFEVRSDLIALSDGGQALVTKPGHAQGTYGVWLGRAETGQATELIVDFGVYVRHDPRDFIVPFELPAPLGPLHIAGLEALGLSFTVVDPAVANDTPMRKLPESVLAEMTPEMRAQFAPVANPLLAIEVVGSARNTVNLDLVDAAGQRIVTEDGGTLMAGTSSNVFCWSANPLLDKTHALRIASRPIRQA